MPFRLPVRALSTNFLGQQGRAGLFSPHPTGPVILKARAIFLFAASLPKKQTLTAEAAQGLIGLDCVDK